LDTKTIDPRLEQLRREPTCDVETAAGLLGVSRGLAYQEARQGSLGGVPVLRIGHRLRVVGQTAAGGPGAGRIVTTPTPSTSTRATPID